MCSHNIHFFEEGRNPHFLNGFYISCFVLWFNLDKQASWAFLSDCSVPQVSFTSALYLIPFVHRWHVLYSLTLCREWNTTVSTEGISNKLTKSYRLDWTQTDLKKLNDWWIHAWDHHYNTALCCVDCHDTLIVAPLNLRNSWSTKGLFCHTQRCDCQFNEPLLHVHYQSGDKLYCASPSPFPCNSHSVNYLCCWAAMG